jgi:endonuclease/exonuclease/phosphatase family metal-dependent hydrolase
MKFRIATFNVENLFERPVAMNQPRWSLGQPALDAMARLNILFAAKVYTPAARRRMLHLLGKFGLLTGRPQNPFLELRVIRGRLLHLPRKGPPSIAAAGRADWLGWVELKKEPIRDEAIVNTARVIAEVNADVLVVVEVESRAGLERFNRDYVTPLLPDPYEHVMVIEGNDPRGIDVGILSRLPIDRMRSHVDDRTDAGARVFSRDCAEYYVALGRGAELVVLANHFASKGSDPLGERRRVQAEAVRAIYKQVRRTHELVVVAGDLNDFPGGGSLDPLLGVRELKDAQALRCYSGLPGTYCGGTAREKIDYLLMSSALRAGVREVGVCRKGWFAPGKWEAFENLDAESRERRSASDHHCLWAEFDQVINLPDNL